MYATNVRRQEYRGWSLSGAGYALPDKDIPLLPDDHPFYKWEKEKRKRPQLPAQIPLELPIEEPPLQPSKRPAWWDPETREEGDRGVITIELTSPGSSLDALLK